MARERSTSAAISGAGALPPDFSAEVVLAPATAGRNTIQPTDPAVIPLVVKGAASQSAALQEWRDSADVVKATLGPAATLNVGAGVQLDGVAGYFRGGGITNFANTGPYLYLGAGTVVQIANRDSAAYVPLVVKGMASQSGDLTQWQDSSGNVMAAVTTSSFRVMRSGTPTQYVELVCGGGTATIKAIAQTNLALAPNGNTRVSINDTASPTVTLSSGGAAAVVCVVKGAASQTANLQEWQDSAATVLAKVDSGGNFAAPSYQAATGTGPYIHTTAGSGIVVLNRTSISNVPLIARGMASQTGDLMQWQDSGASVLAQIKSDGRLVTPSVILSGGATIQNAAGTGPMITVDSSNVTVSNRTTVSLVPLIVKGMASQTGALQEWQDSAAVVKARLYADGTLGVGYIANVANSATYLQFGAASGAIIQNAGSTGYIPFMVKGMASQSGNLQEWRKSDDTIYSTVTENGYFTTRLNSAPADGEIAAGEAAFWFDSTNGASKFMIKAKQADGTVKTGSIALA